MQNAESVRKTIVYFLQKNINEWLTPMLIQAYLLSVGIRYSLEEVESLLNDIYEVSVDSPIDTYVRNFSGICFKCTKYHD